ncbi:unnamed protein product [Mucor hiemalis]
MSTSSNSAFLLPKPLNLVEENLHCHHLLFNKDVTESTYNSENNCFTTAVTELSFRKAKLNGIIVAQKILLSNINEEQEYNIWLDDGTSVIRVIIPNRVLKRADAEYLVPPYNVTLFGKVDKINQKHVIHCGGFNIEDNDASEIYHWIRTMQDRPKTVDAPKEMFHTLSSLPSPKRLLRENFLESPMKEGSNSSGFAWSPDHAFATSTPIRAVQVSPLRTRTDRFAPPMAKSTRKEDSDEFDDDEFGDFGSSVDFDALENDALLLSMTQNNSKKRKIDFANME